VRLAMKGLNFKEKPSDWGGYITTKEDPDQLSKRWTRLGVESNDYVLQLSTSPLQFGPDLRLGCSLI
jgi:hypothetical protein